MSGRKIMDGLRDAVAGNFASVMIEGQRWVRAPEWQGKAFVVTPEAQAEIQALDPSLSPRERLNKAVEIARRSSASDLAEIDIDYKLPCPVQVPPATMIGKGCKLGTLIESIRQREGKNAAFAFPSQPEGVSEIELANKIYEHSSFLTEHQSLAAARCALGSFNVTRKTTEEPRG